MRQPPQPDREHLSHSGLSPGAPILLAKKHVSLHPEEVHWLSGLRQRGLLNQGTMPGFSWQT